MCNRLNGFNGNGTGSIDEPHRPAASAVVDSLEPELLIDRFRVLAEATQQLTRSLRESLGRLGDICGSHGKDLAAKADQSQSG